MLYYIFVSLRAYGGDDGLSMPGRRRPAWTSACATTSSGTTSCSRSSPPCSTASSAGAFALRPRDPTPSARTKPGGGHRLPRLPVQAALLRHRARASPHLVQFFMQPISRRFARASFEQPRTSAPAKGRPEREARAAAGLVPRARGCSRHAEARLKMLVIWYCGRVPRAARVRGIVRVMSTPLNRNRPMSVCSTRRSGRSGVGSCPGAVGTDHACTSPRITSSVDLVGRYHAAESASTRPRSSSMALPL